MKAVSALCFALMLPAVAFAGTHDPHINARQTREHARIAEGVKSGELTHAEAKDLRQGQRQIRREERAAKADGKLTADERQSLRHDLNEQSREIKQQKHDDQTRP